VTLQQPQHGHGVDDIAKRTGFEDEYFQSSKFQAPTSREISNSKLQNLRSDRSPLDV
jgi:hypothetical protein